VPAGVVDAPTLAALRARFDDVYAARYGYSAPDQPVEVVTWKLSAVAGTPKIDLPRASPARSREARRGERSAYFPERGGFVPTPVFDRYALEPGRVLNGPAIVEERESTTVLPPGVSAIVDEYANLIATLVPHAAGGMAGR
jgi:N-methylhydantoinase A